MDTPQLQFLDKVVDMPMVAQRRVPRVHSGDDENHRRCLLHFISKLADITVGVPMHVVEKTNEIPHLRIVESHDTEGPRIDETTQL